MERSDNIGSETLLDCIVVGAGPGGLQAAIHLGRYNFRALLFNTLGGRTGLTKHIENYLGIPAVSGPDLIETGLRQAKSFGVTIENAKVERVTGSEGDFTVQAGGKAYRSRYVIAASGAKETLAPFKNLYKFFGSSYFTCMICDGFHTTGKKLLVIDRTANGVRTSVAMKRMYTRDVTFVAHGFSPTPVYRALLEEEGIGLVEGRPEELVGETALEGLRMSDNSVVPCEVILGWGGISLNDDYLAGLALERDGDGFKFITRSNGESSVPGLFVLGALRHGHSQAIISAGQGAEAAIEISTRIVEL
jgi:thioredoxin reductase (NADPH)